MPGNIAETYNAYTVDKAINAMRNGEPVSGTQIAAADNAMQKLIGPEGEESPWSRIPAAEWANEKNRYFDSFFPQMAELTGNGADLSGIDLSNLILFPTGEELKALINAKADSDGISSLAADNPAAAQNAPQDLTNIPHLPTGEELATLSNASAENGQINSSNLLMIPTATETQANMAAGDNSVLLPGANSPVAQNGQTNVSETAFQTGLSQNATEVPTELSTGKAAGETSCKRMHLPNRFFYRRQALRWKTANRIRQIQYRNPIWSRRQVTK